MVFYSPLLTLVALSLSLVCLAHMCCPYSPATVARKAERNAQTQSYLVEVVSGIQTVKAQNIELRSRWQWQEIYARYVSLALRVYLDAGSISNFLNKLSSLLLLWVGAYLVLQGN